ncbi:MAG: glucose-1-phosphate adenylyltransferase [Candidatus Brocadiia bacterium]
MVKLLKKVMVLVLAGGRGERLGPLTKDRTKPAVPFGGLYRIIDFSLSNAINSNLRKMIVLVQYKCVSLNRHLRDGWSFLSNALGEYIEPLSPQQRVGDRWYTGTADAVFQNIYSIEKEDPEHVLILAGDHIYKMDYNHILKFHRDNNADITISLVEVNKDESSRFGIVEIDKNSQVVGFQEKPSVELARTIPGNSTSCYASMGIYVFKTAVLYKLLQQDALDEKSSHDFGKDIIPNALSTHRIFGFNFIDENKQGPKYWRDVGTIDAYYETSMDLISVMPQLNLYDTDWPIHTAQIQAPPPKFVFADSDRMGTALDSLVCAGCIISGGKVQNSILSPNVRINSYASVSHSILFEGVNVGRRAKIKKAIIDKDVKIPEGMEIGYNLQDDRRRFTVSENGIVLISKGELL